MSGVTSDRAVDGFQQILLPNRFAKNVYGARLHRPHRHGHIDVCANQHYGPRKIALCQLLLKLKSALAGKSDVQNDTPGFFGIVCGYELFYGAVCFSA